MICRSACLKSEGGTLGMASWFFGFVFYIFSWRTVGLHHGENSRTVHLCACVSAATVWRSSHPHAKASCRAASTDCCCCAVVWHMPPISLLCSPPTPIARYWLSGTAVPHLQVAANTNSKTHQSANGDLGWVEGGRAEREFSETETGSWQTSAGVCVFVCVCYIQERTGRKVW